MSTLRLTLVALAAAATCLTATARGQFGRPATEEERRRAVAERQAMSPTRSGAPQSQPQGTNGIRDANGPSVSATQTRSAAHPVATGDSTRRAADLFGDPLPARAIARLGTIRLRNPFGSPIALASDGTKIAASVSHGDVEIRIWEMETGKELGTIPTSEKVGVTAIAFLPGRDALAWVNGTGALVLCDATTGKEVGRLITAVRGDVRMAISPDGNLAALASPSEVSLWELSTGRRVHTFVKWTGNGACLAYSPDGRRIAAASYTPPRRRRSSTCSTPPVARRSPNSPAGRGPRGRWPSRRTAGHWPSAPAGICRPGATA